MNENYGIAACDTQAKLFANARQFQPTVKERLELQKAELEEALANANAALDAFAAHPEVEQVLTALSKAGLR